MTEPKNLEYGEVSVNLNLKTICDENIYTDVPIANQNSVLKRNTPKPCRA